MVEKVDESKLPAWIKTVIAEVAGCFDETSVYRILDGENGWELWFYPAIVEIVGGAHDGAATTPAHWTVEVSEIVELFVKPHVMWCHFANEIPEISIEGMVKNGDDLWLHLLQEPPDDEEARLTFNVYDGSFGEKDESPSDEKKS